MLAHPNVGVWFVELKYSTKLTPEQARWGQVLTLAGGDWRELACPRRPPRLLSTARRRPETVPMTGADWVAVAIAAVVLTAVFVADWVADRRRQRSTDTYLRQSEQRYMTEIRRQP